MLVFHVDAGGEEVGLFEDAVELGERDARLVGGVLSGLAREEFGKFLVEVDEVVGDLGALVLVGAEGGAVEGALDYGADLPAQVVGVHHRHVHALAGFGGVCVGGVAEDEDAVVGGEVVDDALANLVGGEPLDFFVGDGVGGDDLLALGEDLLGGNLGPVHTAVGRPIDLFHLDVEADQGALTGDDHHGTVFCRVDGTAVPDIGEVGDGDDVEYSPDVVGLLADHLETELTADPRMCAITSKHVFTVDNLGAFCLVDRVDSIVFFIRVDQICRTEQAVRNLVTELLGGCTILCEVAEDNLNRVCIVVVHFGFVDLHRLGHDAVLDLGTTILCKVVAEVSLDPSLVQYNLREPGKSRLHIRDAAGSDDTFSGHVGVPEGNLRFSD